MTTTTITAPLSRHAEFRVSLDGHALVILTLGQFEARVDLGQQHLAAQEHARACRAGDQATVRCSHVDAPTLHGFAVYPLRGITTAVVNGRVVL